MINKSRSEGYVGRSAFGFDFRFGSKFKNNKQCTKQAKRTQIDDTFVAATDNAHWDAARDNLLHRPLGRRC